MLRLFFGNQLTETFSQLVEYLTNINKFRILDEGRIFANSLHHASNKTFLWKLIWIQYMARYVNKKMAATYYDHDHEATSTVFQLEKTLPI
jgi:hypothetical protein